VATRPAFRPILFSLLLLHCNAEREKHEASTQPAASEPARVKPPLRVPTANETVDIPGGKFFAGSQPGEPGRVPEYEPRRFESELGPFRIDRLPFPNDPAVPALRGVGRDEAERLCVRAGARLCTELEWERACKGPGNDTYVTGNAWEPLCKEEPRRCASGFDVLSMGLEAREWVRGEMSRDGRTSLGVLRGAGEKSSEADSRCSARRPEDPDKKLEDVGFRCCHGAPNSSRVPPPVLAQTFESTRLPLSELLPLLEAHPRTRALAKDVLYFREPDAANTVVTRGPGDRKGFLFTVLPLLWRPVPGAEYLLLTARSGKDTSFVLAYYVLGPQKYALAASFVMQNEVGPIALAYSSSIKPRVHFSSCWGCPGEGGRILYRDLDVVSIVQP
jgi:hypothetical protein